MHYYVGRFEASQFAAPANYTEHATGFERVSLVNHATGSVHTEACIARLAPGGHIAACVHAYEKGIYVFEGELEILRAGEAIMDIEDQSFRLGAGDVAWTGVGTSHAFRHNGGAPFRWLETQTPQFPAQYGTRNYVEWEKLRAGR